MIQLHALDSHRLDFPPVDQALTDPDGLLAFGGDLSPERLLRAYRAGIFPWYEADQPILWWSPDPRTVIVPGEVHVSRSMKKLLAKKPFDITFNRAFDQVMCACAAPRRGARGTWITDEMRAAYNNLHRLGFAHSVEVWQQQQLVGGLYGIALDQVFFGESMFSRVANASKAGFITLAQKLNERGFKLIDCQVASDHLFTLGAREIPRSEFTQLLKLYITHPQPLTEHAWATPELQK